MLQSETRDSLIRAASSLFRKKGYAGVGLKEILDKADLPKGSLYYHFPQGKVQLAEAATRWAADRIEAMIAKKFESAESFETGMVTICQELADMVSRDGFVPACPVFAILQAAPSEPALRAFADEIYRSWTLRLASEATRFGLEDPLTVATSFHIRLQGAWVCAYAQQSDAPFRHLVDELKR